MKRPEIVKCFSSSVTTKLALSTKIWLYKRQTSIFSSGGAELVLSLPEIGFYIELALGVSTLDETQMILINDKFRGKLKWSETKKSKIFDKIWPRWSTWSVFWSVASLFRRKVMTLIGREALLKNISSNNYYSFLGNWTISGILLIELSRRSKKTPS